MTNIYKSCQALGLAVALALTGCGSEDEVWPDSSSTGSPSSPGRPSGSDASLDPGIGIDGGPNPPQELPKKDLPNKEVPGIDDVLVGISQSDGALSNDPFTADGDVSLYNVMASLSLPNLGALAVTTTTFYCSSPDPTTVDTGNGSVTITRDDQEPAGRSTGDSVSETFNNCTQFNRTMTGARSNTIVSLTGTPFVSAPWTMETNRSVDLTTAMNGTSVKEESDASVSASSSDGVVTTRNVKGTATITVTAADGTVTSRSRSYDITTTTDLNFLTTTKSINFSSSTESGLAIAAKTTQPLAGGIGGAPDSGVLEITYVDAAAGVNRMVRVTAQLNGQAVVETDENNDNVVDSTTTSNWFAVVGATGCGGTCSQPPITTPPGAPGFTGQIGRGPISPVPTFNSPVLPGTFTRPRLGPGLY